MSWNSILACEREKKILQKSILENRVPNSYCLWGIEGIGKEALAIEFAKTVNCLSPIKTKDTISACDECRSCKQITNLSHPNLQLIFSLPAGKTGDPKTDSAMGGLPEDKIDEIKEQLALKAADPYHKISLANANQIKIASIREIKKNLSMSANSSGRRVVIIIRGEEMTSESANAFLKTLEEPHENITIFIVTSNKEALISTILSRCQKIHVSPIPDDILSEAIASKFAKTEAEAKIIAAFAQGSYTRALDSLQDNVQTLRTEAVEILRGSLKKNVYRTELLSFTDKMVDAKDKNKIDVFLKIMLFWMRDVLAVAATKSSEGIINIDQIDRISKFAELFANADISKAVMEIESAIQKIRRNVNPQLSLLTMFINLRRIFLGIDY